MIFDAADLPSSLQVRADLCVVGAGAGGATAAMIAAEAGLSVVVLEAGAFLTPADMSQREDEMFPRLFWEGGNRTTKDRSVKVHQGRGVGGSTLHNLNVCKPIPQAIRDAWRRDRGLEHLPNETWDALYAEVEALLSVSAVPRAQWNRHNLLFERGCEALSWRGGGLSHNRTGCLGSGFCELGCAYDAKNNAAKVMVPRAVQAGAQFFSHCQAVEITHAQSRVTGVRATSLDPSSLQPRGTVIVEAKRVCLSASATATAAILLRSRIPAPEGAVGDGLRIHPAVVVAGEFEEPVNAWRGIPQAYECTEWLSEAEDGHRLWLLPAFAHPVATATFVPGRGEAHRALMERYAHLGVFTAMLHDHTAGRVRPKGDLGLSIDYWPDADDRKELALGLEVCARLLFAAGARKVLVPAFPSQTIHPGDDLSRLREFEITKGGIDLTAVHPMATVPMGDDPRRAAVGSDGAHHHMDGLFIADGSLFPTSIGTPPQLSIYAMGLHVGRRIARA